MSVLAQALDSCMLIDDMTIELGLPVLSCEAIDEGKKALQQIFIIKQCIHGELFENYAIRYAKAVKHMYRYSRFYSSGRLFAGAEPSNSTGLSFCLLSSSVGFSFCAPSNSVGATLDDISFPLFSCRTAAESPASSAPAAPGAKPD